MSSQTEKVLTNYELATDDLAEHLRPLLEADFEEVLEQLEPLQRSELLLALAYSAVSLKFNHLRLQGINPTAKDKNGKVSHPWMQERERMQKYMNKVKEARELLDNADAQRQLVVDDQAALRMVKHYTSQGKRAPAPAPPQRR